MKKNTNKLLTFLCLVLMFGSCKIDNYEGPNASIHGKIVDKQTKELVGTELENGSSIRVFEQGFATPTAQTWAIMNTGEYRNNLVFAATYDVEFTNGNFYPFKVPNFVVKKGDNTYDFEVVPYVRVKNTKIVLDAAAKKVTATFNLEGGAAEVNWSEIRLFAFTDQYVGNNVKFNLNNVVGVNTIRNASPAVINPSTTYTLTIDLTENKDYFKYERNYYFRVGALGSVQNVGTIRHNYSPLVSIPIKL